MEEEKAIAQGKSSISQDIIYEIFSRLPVKSLTRFKCISRFCNSLMSFKFLAWTCPQKKFYTIEQKSQVSDESELIGQAESTAHLIKELNGLTCHKIDYIEGLFCFWNPSEFPPIIFNPSTRKVTSLSCPNFLKDGTNRYHIMLGFEPEEKKYKVFMITYLERSLVLPRRYWILTLGTSDQSWREIKPTIGILGIPSLKGVCIGGVIYFVVCSSNSRECLRLATFNFRTENFGIISFWNKHERTPTYIYFYMNLIEVNGKLAFIDPSKVKTGEMILRILQNSGTGEWMNHTVALPQVAKMNFYHLENCIFSNTLNGEIVLIDSIHKPNWMLFYDLKKNSWREIQVLGLEEKVNIFGIFSYVERA